jgi:hypothetical protein
MAKSKKPIRLSDIALDFSRLEIPRIELPDLSWLEKLEESAKAKGRKPKRRNAKSRLVELAKTLFKEAFPQDGQPPRHFTYKQVETKIRPFYKKHGVESALKQDVIARARGLRK